MKINRLKICLSVGVILLGFISSVLILMEESRAVAGSVDQNHDQTAEIHSSASISKGTILLLLAVGIIGAIGVSRQKKVSGSIMNRSPSARADQHNEVT